MRRNVQLKVDWPKLVAAAAVISLHECELRCGWDLRDERFTTSDATLGYRSHGDDRGLAPSNRLDGPRYPEAAGRPSDPLETSRA
jgi:hypothetical protein